MEAVAQPGRFVYAAAAGKLNVSLFVEPPSCEGEESNEAIYRCFLRKRRSSPLVAASSVRANALPAGVPVSYLVRAELDGQPAQALNVHLLFRRDGKAGDFHASAFQPDADDVQALFALVGSVSVTDR